MKRPYNKWVENLHKVVAMINERKRKEPRHTFSTVLEEPIIKHEIIPIGSTVYPKIVKAVHTDGREKFRFRNADLRYDFRKYVRN